MKKKIFIVISFVIILLLIIFLVYKSFVNNKTKYGADDYPIVYTVIVDMNSNVNEDAINGIKTKLNDNKRVFDIVYESKEERKAYFAEIEIYSEIMKEWPVEYNPFNPRFSISARAKDENNIKEFIKEIENWNNIYQVQYNLKS